MYREYCYYRIYLNWKDQVRRFLNDGVHQSLVVSGNGDWNDTGVDNPLPVDPVDRRLSYRITYETTSA